MVVCAFSSDSPKQIVSGCSRGKVVSHLFGFLVALCFATTLKALLVSLEVDVLGLCGTSALCLSQWSLSLSTRDCATLLGLLGKHSHKMRRLSGGFSCCLLWNNFASFSLVQS